MIRERQERAIHQEGEENRVARQARVGERRRGRRERQTMIAPQLLGEPVVLLAIGQRHVEAVHDGQAESEPEPEQKHQKDRLLGPRHGASVIGRADARN